MPAATPRLYDDLAYLWPLLSPPEDYAAEAVAVMDAVEPYLHHKQAAGERPTLIEFGAGGGHSLVYLQDRFACTAVDLSEPMLAHCRDLVPEAEAIVGDMRHLRLERTFDVVLMHDAIDYMTSPEDARAALATAAAHLAPGGVCVVAPTYIADGFEDGQYEADHALVEGQRLTYLSYLRRRPENTERLDLHLTYVLDDGERVEVTHDLHECGLFSLDQWRDWLRDAGLLAVTAPKDAGAWHGFIARHHGASRDG